MRLHRVVVGIDFTDASLAAARWAATHFAPDAEIVFVHVVPSVQVPSLVQAHLSPTPETAPPGPPTVDGGLRGLVNLVGGGRARWRVLPGNPAEALARVAEEVDADVVCVGRGPRRRGTARFGATTPLRLLTCTDIPTLVVPAGPFETPARLLAAVDDCSGAMYLVDVACRLAAVFEAGVDALHVIEPALRHSVATGREAPHPVDNVRMPAPLSKRGDVSDELHVSWLRDRACAWVDTMLDGAGPDGDWTAPVIRCGDAGQEIIRHARDHGADLIVIGRGGDATRARASGALLLGSTARLVLWTAPCPVLVLPLDGSPAMLPPSPMPPHTAQRS